MKRIEEINNPKFIKKLNINEMIELSNDIREFILNNISQTGGHLSSNLGIIDLTIAMLKVFEPSKDIIIFDVGHQCYPYKILTGRAKEFSTLRKYNGLSGFQSINESNYDKYEAEMTKSRTKEFSESDFFNLIDSKIGFASTPLL